MHPQCPLRLKRECVVCSEYDNDPHPSCALIDNPGRVGECEECGEPHLVADLDGGTCPDCQEREVSRIRVQVCASAFKHMSYHQAGKPAVDLLKPEEEENDE